MSRASKARRRARRAKERWLSSLPKLDGTWEVFSPGRVEFCDCRNPDGSERITKGKDGSDCTVTTRCNECCPPVSLPRGFHRRPTGKGPLRKAWTGHGKSRGTPKVWS